MMSGSHQLLFVSVAFLVCLCQAWAITCIVCQDCTEPKYDANSTRACGKKEDRCIKMVLVNEEVDRACGDSKLCTGRVPTRKPRSLIKPKSKPEELTNYAPKQRTIRQLLGASPVDKGGDGKAGTVEISEMYCCDEDECNGSVPTFNPNSQTLLIVLSISCYFLYQEFSCLFKL